VPRRQLIVFKLGCAAALLTAAMQLAGHLVGRDEPANETERELFALADTYRFTLPGGAQRTFTDLTSGAGLMVPLLLALVGGLGYIVQKRAGGDVVLMLAVARAIAAACAVMLVISLTHFFIVPSMFMALMTTCFGLASVKAPITEKDHHEGREGHEGNP
jgi:hypothetical protein